MKVIFNPKVIFGPMDNNPTTSGIVKYAETEDQPMTIWKEDASGNRINDFKLLTVSDFHLCHDTDNDALVFDVLDQMLKKEKPDLVILLGDNIVQVSDNIWQGKLVDFFEDKNQYWTFVLGNHDGQGWEGKGYEYWDSREQAFNTLSGIFKEGDNPAPHCLARSLAFDPSNRETYGYGTNLIEVLGTDNQILSSLFFFDCEAIIKKNDQFVNWFNNEVELTRQDDQLPEVLTFSHIPYVEMQEAWDKRKSDDSVTFNYGVKQESICYDTDEKSGLFDCLVQKAKETKVTSVFGHDHVNNISLTYKGVKLMYTLGLQYNTYNTRTEGGYSVYINAAHIIDDSFSAYLDGATTYRIQAGQDAIISNRYNQFTGVFDSIQDILWKKTHMFTYKNAHPLTISIRVVSIVLALWSITYFVFFADNKLGNRRKNHKKDK